MLMKYVGDDWSNTAQKSKQMAIVGSFGGADTNVRRKWMSFKIVGFPFQLFIAYDNTVCSWLFVFISAVFLVSFFLLYFSVYSVCICMTKQIYTSAFFLAATGQRVYCTKLFQNGSDVEPACSWTAGTFSWFSWYELRSSVTVQSSRRNESVDFLGLSHPVLLL